MALAVLVFIAYSPVAPQSEPAELAGVVILSEDVQVSEPTIVQNSTDPGVCGELHSIQDVVVEPESRGLRHAIVVLRGETLSTTPVEPGRFVIDNRECRFEPHVAVATVGSTIEALNSDDVLHTVHLYGPIEVNLGLPIKHMRRSQRIDESGLFSVKCDVHGWMQAYVRVDTHPFHAVTDPDGAFRIGGVPPGEYTIEVWHETLGTIERQIRLVSGESASVLVEYGPQPSK